MTIPALRRVHLRALHRLGSVLKARSMLIIPNDCDTQYSLWNGMLFKDVMAKLEAELGPPQPTVDSLKEDWRDEMWRWWFLEDVIESAKP